MGRNFGASREVCVPAPDGAAAGSMGIRIPLCVCAAMLSSAERDPTRRLPSGMGILFQEGDPMPRNDPRGPPCWDLSHQRNLSASLAVGVRIDPVCGRAYYCDLSKSQRSDLKEIVYLCVYLIRERQGFSAHSAACLCFTLRRRTQHVDTVRNRRAASLPLASLVAHWASTSLILPPAALSSALPGR